ncbi:MAG: hypothetical protein LBB28_04875 [Synergistaceae bacterium]|nr:hypothetical protein [Synergistaceae bacterium]
MIFVGVTLNLAGRSSGAGRVSIRSGDSYNILQSEIERARSALKAEMSSREDPLKCGLSEKEPIDSLDDLEILKDGKPFWRVDYSKNVEGVTGDVSVRIYDMKYSPANVTPGAFAAALPPSVILKAAGVEKSEVFEPGTPDSAGSGSTSNAGVYLIRAAITLAGKITNKIDISVIQNSNPKT